MKSRGLGDRLREARIGKRYQAKTKSAAGGKSRMAAAS